MVIDYAYFTVVKYMDSMFMLLKTVVVTIDLKTLV